MDQGRQADETGDTAQDTGNAAQKKEEEKTKEEKGEEGMAFSGRETLCLLDLKFPTDGVDQGRRPGLKTSVEVPSLEPRGDDQVDDPAGQ